MCVLHAVYRVGYALIWSHTSTYLWQKESNVQTYRWMPARKVTKRFWHNKSFVQHSILSAREIIDDGKCLYAFSVCSKS